METPEERAERIVRNAQAEVAAMIKEREVVVVETETKPDSLEKAEADAKARLKVAKAEAKAITDAEVLAESEKIKAEADALAEAEKMNAIADSEAEVVAEV